ncbi:MAG: periplasmic heavy metal sensor [Anaerolineae bacterium]
MSKRVTLIIAGVVTALVLVLVLGVAGGASWFSPATSAAGNQSPSATAAGGAVCLNPQDAAALQAQLNDYQAALQQANTQLQAAYNEIAQLQAQGRFSGEHEEHEHEGTFFNPFGND